MELMQLDGCGFDLEMEMEIGIEIEGIVVGRRKEEIMYVL
jgi:hypothetical protein